MLLPPRLCISVVGLAWSCRTSGQTARLPPGLGNKILWILLVLPSKLCSQRSLLAPLVGVPPGGPWTQASGPRRVVPGKRSQVPTADVLRDLQRLKGKKAGGGGQICNQGQRASRGQG